MTDENIRVASDTIDLIEAGLGSSEELVFKDLRIRIECKDSSYILKNVIVKIVYIKEEVTQ